MTVSLDQLETTYCTIQGGDKTALGIMHSSESKYKEDDISLSMWTL